MSEIILPNISDDGKWIGDTFKEIKNSDNAIESFKYKSLTQKKADVYGRK